jgi:hypothetical protein
MRVGEWTAAVDRNEPAAWRVLFETTLRAARRLRARDPEDLAAALVLDQFRLGARHARLCDDKTSLAAWVSGCVRRCIARERRREHRMTALLPSMERALACPRRAARRAEPWLSRKRTELRRRIRERLTPAERQAVDLFLAGLGQRAAARTLRIGRDAYRDRFDRAKAKLAAAVYPRPRRAAPLPEPLVA